MFNRILTLTKRHLNVILLFAGLILLSCTIFCFYGWGFHAVISDYTPDGVKVKEFAVGNFFGMILGFDCAMVNFGEAKVEVKKCYGSTTPIGMLLLIFQILIILITIVFVLNFIFKRIKNKKFHMYLALAAVALGIVTTVLALTPVNYINLMDGKRQEIISLATLLNLQAGDDSAVIQLTSCQIAYLVIAVAGILSCIGGLIFERIFKSNPSQTPINPSANEQS